MKKPIEIIIEETGFRRSLILAAIRGFAQNQLFKTPESVGIWAVRAADAVFTEFKLQRGECDAKANADDGEDAG